MNTPFIDISQIKVGDKFARLVFKNEQVIENGTYTCVYTGPGRYVFRLNGATDYREDYNVKIPKDMLQTALFNDCPGVIKISSEE